MTLQHISQLVSLEAAPPVTPSIRRPSSPDSLVPHMLHRGHDGMIPLARKVCGNWQEVGSLPASHMSGLFANEFIADAMSVDAYFGLHGMYRPARKLKSGRNLLPGLTQSVRGVDAVRWLTCFHIDLDAYRNGMDTHGAIAAMNRLVDAGVLPSPSIYTLSRGVWALWRLHDREHHGEPLRAYPNHIVRRWAAIQDVLHKLCARIGSDPAARNASTLSRIPGSVNSKCGERVGYMIPASSRGSLYSYTLEDMESFFRDHLLSRVVTVATTDRIPSEKRKALGRRGSVTRWNLMLESLKALRDMRGGWREGTRNNALFYVCVACVNLGMEDADILRELSCHVHGMEETRKDSVSLKDAKRTLRAVRKGKDRRGSTLGHVRNQTIADSLSVTPDEASILSAGRRYPFPPALSHGGLVPKLSKAEETAKRRQAVERIVGSLKAQGYAPSGTDIRAHLLAEGMEATLKTVLKDMEAVGSPSSKAHRRATSQGTLFPGG